MRTVLFAAGLALFTAVALGCHNSAGLGSGGSGGGGEGGAPPVTPPWLTSAQIVVSGETTNNTDCTTGVCRHSENTDLINWQNAIYLVHRTAESQVLGPNSSLRISKSTDGGQTFTLQAIIPALPTRDIRDPAFYVVGDKLYIKTLTRLPVISTRDTGVDTIAQGTSTTDGVHWSAARAHRPGDVELLAHQAAGRRLLLGGVPRRRPERLPLLVARRRHLDRRAPTSTPSRPTRRSRPSSPSCRRASSWRWCAWTATDAELLGDVRPPADQVCWADPPYSSFACPADLRRRAPRRAAQLLPRRAALRRRPQAPRGRRPEAHVALRDHRDAGGRPARHQGVGRAAERGRHVVRGHRHHRRRRTPLLSLVLGQPGEGRGVGAGDVRRDGHLAGDARLLPAPVSGEPRHAGRAPRVEVGAAWRVLEGLGIDEELREAFGSKTSPDSVYPRWSLNCACCSTGSWSPSSRPGGRSLDAHGRRDEKASMSAGATHLLTRLGGAAALLLTSCSAPRARRPAGAVPPAPVAAPSEVERVAPPLRDFYGKRLREGGIPILAHASVSDEALFAARDHLRRALGRAPGCGATWRRRASSCTSRGCASSPPTCPSFACTGARSSTTGSSTTGT